MSSWNGKTPEKTPEQVATELRERLEHRLGQEKTDSIWEDPTNVQDVIHGEREAADVAEIMLKAWQELPSDESGPATPRKRSRFRRGLQIAMIAAMAVWAVSMMKRLRSSSDEE
jgi:hypothetical protein